MKPRCAKQRNHALTRVEVLAIAAVTGALLCVALAWSVQAWRKAKSICCVCNLDQVSLSFQSWKGDHYGEFPMQVSITNGGVMELVTDGKNVWPTFQVMSNELSTPKVLVCPRDAGQRYATNFANDFGDSNISYFVNLDATGTDPQRLLCGDDNLTVHGEAVSSGILNLWTNTTIAWTKERHDGLGNIGLTDGSVRQVVGIADGLTKYLKSNDSFPDHVVGVATNRLAIP